MLALIAPVLLLRVLKSTVVMIADEVGYWKQVFAVSSIGQTKDAYLYAGRASDVHPCAMRISDVHLCAERTNDAHLCADKTECVHRCAEKGGFCTVVRSNHDE